MAFKGLIPTWYRNQIRTWLQEDIPSFDYSGYVVGDTQEQAILYGKSEGVIAGVPFFEMVFEEVGCQVEWLEDEGKHFKPTGPGRAGALKVARVTGTARAIMMGERLALNIFCRAGGIAFQAKKASDIAKENNWQGRLAATRKTTPGFREVEKYAALVGGCDTHRFDLSSMIMLKDNAIVSCGSITAAVEKARQAGGFSIKIEVECGSEAEASEAIEAGADVIMLDNMSPEELKGTAARLKQAFADRRFLIEASGGITLETCAAYMCPSVDVISMGCIIQGVPHVDFSLKIVRD